jgi:AraC-like DNA-binding protein
VSYLRVEIPTTYQTLAASETHRSPTNVRADDDFRDAPRSNPLIAVVIVPPVRHLLRAKDLADSRYAESLGVDDLAASAGLSRAHFSREFRRAFGESPHAYLLTRRLERAASLLRMTDRSVTEICFAVGLRSVGSFTSSFTRTYGIPPTVYRAAFPPAAAHARIPGCVLRAYGRPQHSTFREDNGRAAHVAWPTPSSTKEEP